MLTKTLKALLASSFTSKKPNCTKNKGNIYFTIPDDSGKKFELIRYREEECLGTGSFCAVYKANQLDENGLVIQIPKKNPHPPAATKDKSYALKIFGSEDSARFEETITKEVYKTKKPVAPFFFGSYGKWCLITELQKGVPFQPTANVLQQLNESTLIAKIKAAIKLLAVFHSLHHTTPSRNLLIAHGDIHGNNILFHTCKNGAIRLSIIDFGEAKYFTDDQTLETTYISNCISPPETNPNRYITTCVTPELIDYSGKYGIKSDIFSLSYVLNLLFTRRVAKPAQNLRDFNGPILAFPTILNYDIGKHVTKMLSMMRAISYYDRPNIDTCLTLFSTILQLVEIQELYPSNEDKKIEKTGLIAKVILLTSGTCDNLLGKKNFKDPDENSNCQRIIALYQADEKNVTGLAKIADQMFIEKLIMRPHLTQK